MFSLIYLDIMRMYIVYGRYDPFQDADRERVNKNTKTKNRCDVQLGNDNNKAMSCWRKNSMQKKIILCPIWLVDTRACRCVIVYLYVVVRV